MTNVIDFRTRKPVEDDTGLSADFMNMKWDGVKRVPDFIIYGEIPQDRYVSLEELIRISNFGRFLTGELK